MNKYKMAKFNKIFLFSILIALIVVILSYFLIARLITPTFVKNCLDKYTNLNFEFQNAKINLDYKFNLSTTADSIKIYDKNKKILFLDMQNPKIKVQPVAFLFNKADIENFETQKIILNITKDENGKIDLINSLKPELKNLDFSRYDIKRLKTKISNSQINYQNNFKTKSNTKITLNETNIDISKNKELFNISQTGKIETSKEGAYSLATLKIFANYSKNEGVVFDADINNLDLELLSNYFKNGISKDIQKVTGRVDLNVKTKKEREIQKLALKLKKPQIHYNSGKNVLIDDEINVKMDFCPEKNLISINKLLIKSPNMAILTKGEIIKPYSKKPQAKINVLVKETQIANLVHLLPDNLIYYRPQGIPTLKKSNFHAILNGEINIEATPVNITGSIKASNVHIPNFPKPYRQNDVYLTFLGDKMSVVTRIYTPDNEYVTIKGISNLDDSLWGKYSVKSTKKIDLKYAQMYLVPVQQIIGFNIGPVPIMKMDGFGNINITTQGTIFDAQIFGDFEAYNASASIEGLGANLVQGDCKLIFDDRNLIFKEIKGKLDGADFLLAGKGNTKGEVSLNVKILNAYASKILKIFENSVISRPYMPAFKNIAATSGLIDINIDLKGTIKNYEDKSLFEVLEPSGNFKFKNNKVILNNKFALKHLKGQFDFGQKQEANVEFMANNSKINVQFLSNNSLNDISKGKEFVVSSHISSNKLALNDIQKNLHEVNFFTKFDLNSVFKATIKEINLKTLKNKGYIAFLNSEENKNVKFQNALIKFDNNKMSFDNFDANYKTGSIKIRGYVLDYLTNSPHGNLNVSMQNIALDALKGFLPKIKFENAILKTGQIALIKDNLKFNSINIDYNDIPINLSANLRNVLSKDRTLNVYFSTVLDEQAADSLINPFLTYPVKIKGQLPFKGQFKGNINDYDIDFFVSAPEQSDISYRDRKSVV